METSDSSAASESDSGQTTQEISADSRSAKITRLDARAAAAPKRVGRYRTKKLLGQGGFGLVYLAQDEQLDRQVAIKIPHPVLVTRSEDAEAYLAEARAVANLDHPNIAPVFDIGSTDAFPCYVVSKYVDGIDLATKIRQDRPGYLETAELVATVADALDYAHKRGLVHRDVKPGNILIDKSDKPHLADFGLALREENVGKGPRYAGTPAYMSPEQARGEGHRVDGRSDIFSLGVAFYELLVGRKPFRGDTQAELLAQITGAEPRSVRQYDDHIPRELERICQKALAKRASERYATAKDLASDLRQFLAEQTVTQRATTPGGTAAGPEWQASASTPAFVGSGFFSDSHPFKIVPKGLRPFDAHDADFFLDLLPGPQDRQGLPESLRFWKIWIEETDPDHTFPVGLIYGPSGCGKSSLVKAGLLPRLSEDIISVYVDATPDETETRLLHGLQKCFAAVQDNPNLKETLAALRQGQGTTAGKKVLIVLDQFEQWLHARKDSKSTDLVQALRQCDGRRVQCILMVRDDFWLAVSRFVRELEVRLLEGSNVALVDVFDFDHARKVLAAFGRAFGRLPENVGDMTAEQKDFLRESVTGLAKEGKVICVRLALFAEMMKGHAWTAATLNQVGGTKGVGVTFLEETFSSSRASPEHRYHETAARAVLTALLPDSDADIIGQMKPYDELLEASGYASRPKEFDDLIQILDSEMRLITPTDPEGVEADLDSLSRLELSHKYYQLTHDYLIHSLRDWLTRKQRETRRGRAELRLGELAAAWNAKPESRYLPSAVEWARIALLTRRQWTEPQRKMMQKATRRHTGRVAVLLMLAAIVSLGGYALSGWYQARALVASLVRADVDQVLEIADELSDYRRWAEPRLQRLVAIEPQTSEERRRQLHARLALTHYDSSQIQRLLPALLIEGDPSYLTVIREALLPHQATVAGQLWEVLHDTSADRDMRFRAGLALAAYEPQAEQWTREDDRLLVERLVASNPVYQTTLWKLVTQVSQRLLKPLTDAFLDPQRPESERIAAANALARFAAKETAFLAGLIVRATPGQYEVLYPLLAKEGEVARAPLLRLIKQQPADGLSEEDRVDLGTRRAGAAVTLLRQGDQQAVLDVLRVREDPEALTQFVYRCRARGVTPGQLLQCLDCAAAVRQAADKEEREVLDRVLYGVLLSLGEFDLADVPETSRKTLIANLADWYATHPSSAVHGATGWLLRKWGYEEKVTRVDHTPLAFDESGTREWFVMRIEPTVNAAGEAVSGGQPIFFTFVVFPPGQYIMGSSDGENNRQINERQHRVTLDRAVAVSDREITWAQFDAFDNGGHHNDWSRRFSRQLTSHEPAFGVNWFEAVSYCRWLTSQVGMSESDQCYAEKELPASARPGWVDLPPSTTWPVHLNRPGFRLLTEAEFEYVCRSGTTTPYSFGSDRELLHQYAWWLNNADEWSHAVGQLRPNLKGLFDLHGNVWEWCHDYWIDAGLADGTAPVGAPRGLLRVRRGGSWRFPSSYCRSSNRGRITPRDHNNNLGFRVALLPLASEQAGGAETGSR